MLKKYFLASIIGSSIYATVASFLYNGNAFKNLERPSDIPYEWFPIFIPTIFGFSNVLNVYIQSKINNVNTRYMISGFIGMILGIIISLLGMNLPDSLSEDKVKSYTNSAIIYSLIFIMFVQPMNEYFENCL